MIIYKITNKINSKVYIGRTTKTLAARWSSHVSGHNRCFRLKLAIIKYGKDNFLVEKIDEALSLSELIEKEKYWILHYDSIQKGYNIKLGDNLTEEIAAKIAKSHTGKKASPEAKLKMSLAKRGRKLSEEHRKLLKGRIPWNKGKGKPKENKERFRLVIMQYDENYKLINTFESIEKAARYLISNNISPNTINGTASNIRIAANKLRGFSYGYRWKLERDKFLDFKEDYKPSPKPILRKVKLVKDNCEFLFNSIKEASIFASCHPANIIRSCKTTYKVNGYKAEYLEVKYG